MSIRGLIVQLVAVAVSVANLCCALLLEHNPWVILNGVCCAMIATVVGSTAKRTGAARWPYWLLLSLGLWWLSCPTWVPDWRAAESQWCAIIGGIVLSALALSSLSFRFSI
jgi:hypothetical protein